MTTELAKLRNHYELLPAHVQARKTAQCLLRAIQIAEAYQEVSDAASVFYHEAERSTTTADRLRDAIARATNWGK